MAIIKKFSIAVLLVLLALNGFAQATADELFDGYVSASVNGENITPYLTKINQMYKNYREEQQTAFRNKIYDRINSDTIVEQKGLAQKVALIDLYTLLADSNDDKLDDLYFQKGEICGLHTGDTIMLKECIIGLKLSNQSKTAKVNDYITTLQDYLEQIRNILPVSQRIDGVWVSDRITNNEWINKIIYHTPAFVLNIHQGNVKLENVGIAINFTDFSFLSENVKNDEQTYAQSVVDISRDKIYLAWSSEKLKIPNQAIALSLGQTAGDITTNVVREGTSSFIGDIGGDLMGGIAGNVIGGLVTNMFAPSKKIYVLEMELEQKNECELKGHYCFQTIKIDGNGQPDIIKEEDDLYFIKYDIESCVYFGSSGDKYKYIPGCGLSKDFDLSTWQGNDSDLILTSKSFKSLAKKYQKAFYAHNGIFSSYPRFQSYFSPHQIKKLIYYAEQKLLQQGIKQEDLCYGNRKTPVMGIYYKNRTGKKVKIPKDMKGVYIYDVEKENSWYAPAFLFGIKQGDIIMSIDGYEMDSPEKFLQYIQSLKPYDWITIHIMRNGKEKDIDVELTWY